MLQAIIFDVDGTLAETEEVHRAAFNRAFADAGLDWHWSEALYGDLLKVTGGKERLAFYIDMTGGLGMSVIGVERLIADLHRCKTAIYAQMMSDGQIKLRPGVAELIEGALTDDIRLAIATTTSRPNVDALLRSTLGADGAGAFEVIAAGESVPRKKPAPDVFVATLAGLGLPPENCLAIEDSENGLRSAIGAGLATLVTPSHYSRGENFAGAARVVEALPALAEPNRSAATPSPAQLIDAIRALHRSFLGRPAGHAFAAAF
ncbi:MULTISPECIES: HAD-IA family hydrolase [Rhodomicrobium]|uniref:HAD-IA family hydrolase n=1 Tax=Rhodomicrobium TaxID=1068 RepID=UPI000B4B0D90|nr:MULTISPECIES: HAD-IA family hydrolase [Rhodomicrobium]